MNILSLSRDEVQAFINSGFLKKEDMRHYDVCKAMAQGKSQFEVAREFNLTDDSHARYIKRKKCPECDKKIQ